MAQQRPTHEAGISYRLQDDGTLCCYVTIIYVGRKGQSRIIGSRHFSGASPTSLIDQVEHYVRSWTLEHILPLTSPF